MKKYLIITVILFSLYISASNTFFGLMEEGDYFRAAGEYKRIMFVNGINDTANYYLMLCSIYTLSDMKYITEEMYSKASYSIDNMEQLRYASMLNSYINFKSGNLETAFMEIETFLSKDDSIFISLKFLNEMVNKKDSIYTIPNILSDSIKEDIKQYLTINLKSPDKALILSSLIPGLGEAYANNYKDAFRDFFITTCFTGITVYAFLKNQNNMSISPFEISWDYIKSRDWVLVFTLYSFFLTRFQNGSKTNALESVYEFNDKLYEKYLTKLYNYIDMLYKNRILTYIYSNV